MEHNGGMRVSVCLPARDEEATVGRIVRVVRGLVDTGSVHELVVVDDGSTDATARVSANEGAHVVVADGSRPGSAVGKGGAMRTGLAATSGDIVVYCDADVRNFTAEFVMRLVAPFQDPTIQFVKAYYERPLYDQPGGGGRVTELVARPLISLLFPQLSHLRQPLAGECAGRRDALESVVFEAGYAVDLALVIDFAEHFGVESIAQVDLGVRVHRNRSLEQLSGHSRAILAMALQRAGLDLADRRLSPSPLG